MRKPAGSGAARHLKVELKRADLTWRAGRTAQRTRLQRNECEHCCFAAPVAFAPQNATASANQAGLIDNAAQGWPICGVAILPRGREPWERHTKSRFWSGVRSCRLWRHRLSRRRT